MTHHHLGFQGSHRLKSNADQNQQGCTAQSNIACFRNKHGEEDRENCDQSEENRTDEGNLGDYSGNKISGRFARTNTGDRTVVLKEII